MEDSNGCHVINVFIVNIHSSHLSPKGVYSYSLYEPKSHALMEYNGGLGKAILGDSELLSEVNDAFCKSHPLLAQKVVTRSAPAAVSKIGA